MSQVCARCSMQATPCSSAAVQDNKALHTSLLFHASEQYRAAWPDGPPANRFSVGGPNCCRHV